MCLIVVRSDKLYLWFSGIATKPRRTEMDVQRGAATCAVAAKRGVSKIAKCGTERYLPWLVRVTRGISLGLTARPVLGTAAANTAKSPNIVMGHGHLCLTYRILE